MKKIICGLVAAIVLLTSASTVVAQGATTPGACSEFQTYWETVVSTMPDDPEGAEAFLDIVDSGPRTVLTEEQQVSAYSFLNDWSANLQQVSEDVIPESARLWHQDLTSDFDMTASLIEYGDLNDLSSTISFWSVGIFVLLMEEAETPAQCI